LNKTEKKKSAKIFPQEIEDETEWIDVVEKYVLAVNIGGMSGALYIGFVG
jgi:hypothetical protein